MRILNKKKLEKLKRKAIGNKQLKEAVDQLIEDIESSNWKNQVDLKKARPDADNVHSDGFYFFDIHVHRTMILIEFGTNGEATVVWTGNPGEYQLTFKNNKSTIRKWLKSNDWI